MNKEELFAFLVVEYEYECNDSIIVVVAKNEDEAKKIATENYGMMIVDDIKKVELKINGYYEFGSYCENGIAFVNV